MIDPQTILTAIKDYGAAIISTVSLGGIAGAVAVIVKVKQAFDKLKETMNKTLAQKDEAINKATTETQTVIAQNKVLCDKIDQLTQDVYKLEKDINVKGNRKN